MTAIQSVTPDESKAIASLRQNIAASIAGSGLTLDDIQERSGIADLPAAIQNAEALTMGQIYSLSLVLGVRASEWFRVNPA